MNHNQAALNRFKFSVSKYFGSSDEINANFVIVELYSSSGEHSSPVKNLPKAHMHTCGIMYFQHSVHEVRV